MNATRHRSRPSPEARRMAVCSDSARSPAARSAWWVLGAPALALASTLVVVVAGAPGDWIGAIWLVAVLWTVAASLVQALRAGFRHADWSAFACAGSSCPALPCAAPPRDDDGHDWSTRTGAFAYRRIRDEIEAHSREGDRYLQDHDRLDSPT